jgi:photosystem II stability/assembly factor-like uncharacterized protein
MSQRNNSKEIIMKHRFSASILFLIVMFGLSTADATTQNNLNKFAWNKAYFYNFYGVCPLSSGEVWIVGSKGMICKRDNQSREWWIQESGVSGNLYYVTFTDPENGWISGQNGLILHTRDGGKSWTRQESGTKEHLFSICFRDKKTGWIVGAFGTILHTSDGGMTWQKQGDGLDQIYNSVCFTDDKHGWVVGEFGVILSTVDGGKNWTAQQNPLEEKTLFSVYFKDRYTGWATGMDGSILFTHNGGTTWNPMNFAMKENLLSIHARGEQQWAVGLKGSFTRRNGNLWKDATDHIPTRAWLKQCHFVNEKNGWIVGSVGTVLHTADGGETWTPAGASP